MGRAPLPIVVPIEGAEERITADGLQEHLRQFVADGVIATWAVPDHYTFVKEVPKTSVGKIDKQVLRGRYPAAPADWLRANLAVARPKRAYAGAGVADRLINDRRCPAPDVHMHYIKSFLAL